MHPRGDSLINTITENCDSTIVVVRSVGLVDMEPSPVLVDILYGEVNPSGRLVYTIVKNPSDYAQSEIVAEPQPYPQNHCTEGVPVDSRGFEKNNTKPRFAFGHGLSYSTFTYTDLDVFKHRGLTTALEAPIDYVRNAPGGDMALYDVAMNGEVTI
ncbi:glycoside hydrolase family 3 protein [Penicillium antarcticum]|uniref:glycoside hydrolase family 3 protein n=1 Tax=Penicillium antarcticum TaxID=416450 RepID=UPI0023A2389B|nr:glycoside hydrolase family 3 protein [Penicillium antarcticum]KAJ5295905.1 glycoside hydrolase family 3 protein [Penicillium antarcticum]